jgi:hypothetical protein
MNKRTMFAGVVLFGGLVGITGLNKYMGEEVFRGNIDGQDVVYEEGIFNLIETARNPIHNKMTVSKGVTTYTLLDDVDQNPISWKQDTAPDYVSDTLEQVVIRNPEGTRKYDISHIDTETLDGKHAQNIFDKTNKMYNDLRTKIREKLRSDYQKELGSIEDTLK